MTRTRPARSCVSLALIIWLVLLGFIVPQPVAAAEADVTITWTLEPAELTVSPNTTVTWTNTDGARHRVRATSGPDEFDSGSLENGESFSFTFSEIGTYQYRDDRNPDLSNYWGTIIVQAGGGGGGGGTAPAGADVRMAGRVFRPQTITVQAGESIVFLNDDGRDHTVTARDRSFDSGIMSPGADYVRTFSAAGTYEYFCAIHPDMVGTVLVEGPGGAPPPPPPPPPSPPGSADVTIVDFGFGPATLTVTAGSTVSWVNSGAALHTVTARDGTYDSGFLVSGDTFTRTYATSGAYEYFCTLHPDMVGTILVTGGTGTAPPPPGSGLPPVAGDLSIVDFAYQPGTITVPVGTTLKWANNGVAPHTVTARSGLYDSGILARGETFSFTFGAPGTYEYFCTLHPDMTASVIVPSSTGEIPAPLGAPPPPPPSKAGDVQMIDFAFAPANLTVPQGTTVGWVNTGVALHTATARNGAFDSGFLNTGDSFEFRFLEAGTFQYFCTLHPGMTGTIAVAAGEGTVPPGSSDDQVPSAAVDALPADIAMLDFVFDPVDVTVAAGNSITWVNRGAALHTATALDGTFDSGFLSTGESFSLSIEAPGTMEYYCIVHPGMIGTITVIPASTAPSAPEVGVSAAQQPAQVGDHLNGGTEAAALPESQRGVDRAFSIIFAILGSYFLFNVVQALRPRRGMRSS